MNPPSGGRIVTITTTHFSSKPAGMLVDRAASSRSFPFPELLDRRQRVVRWYAAIEWYA